MQIANQEEEEKELHDSGLKMIIHVAADLEPS
jgi:hypothetical protein